MLRKIVTEICVIATMLMLACGTNTDKKVEALEPTVITVSEPRVIYLPVIAENTVTDEYKIAYENLLNMQNLLITDPVTYMDKYNSLTSNFTKIETATIYDIYGEQDVLMIEKCVETETYGCQVFIDKVHIADVILNRVNHPTKFGSTPSEVVSSPGQFAYGRSNISDLTRAAVEYAFQNADTTQGALYFHSGSKTETFNGASYIFTDSTGHHFYK